MSRIAISILGTMITFFICHAGKDDSIGTINTESSVTSICVTGKDKIIVSGHADGKVRIWDMETGNYINTLFDNDEGKISSIRVTSDGKYIMAGSSVTNIGILKIWDIATQKLVETIRINGYVGPSRNGKYLVLTPHKKPIEIWNIAMGKCNNKVLTIDGYNHEACYLTITNDEKCFIIGSKSKTIDFFDIATKKFVNHIVKYINPVSWINSVQNGRYLVTKQCDGTRINIEDTQTRMSFSIINKVIGFINLMCITPNEKYLIFTRDDKINNNTINFYDIEEKKLITNLNCNDQQIISFDITTDGKYIVSGSQEKTIKIWKTPEYCWTEKPFSNDELNTQL